MCASAGQHTRFRGQPTLRFTPEEELLQPCGVSEVRYTAPMYITPCSDRRPFWLRLETWLTRALPSPQANSRCFFDDNMEGVFNMTFLYLAETILTSPHFYGSDPALMRYPSYPSAHLPPRLDLTPALATREDNFVALSVT